MYLCINKETLKRYNHNNRHTKRAADPCETGRRLYYEAER